MSERTRPSVPVDRAALIAWLRASGELHLHWHKNSGGDHVMDAWRLTLRTTKRCGTDACLRVKL